MHKADTIAECLRHAQAQGLARIDAQMLLLHCLQRPLHDRAWLLAHDRDHLRPTQNHQLQAVLKRRLSGEPVAYITGCKDFFGLSLAVDARVLDPRPDTETLVEWALALLPNAGTPQILDLGTGSGAVALALQHHRPCAKVWAVDASLDALDVARSNAQRLNLAVQFIASHWMAQLHAQRTGLFDLIVSNPPYVAEGDPHLAGLTHEPLQALTSGADGLDDIRQIVTQAPEHLRPGGWLLLEHGWDQSGAVHRLMTQAGFAQVQSRPDLAGVARCTGGIWTP